jgi:hypothetical protein
LSSEPRYNRVRVITEVVLQGVNPPIKITHVPQPVTICHLDRMNRALGLEFFDWPSAIVSCFGFSEQTEGLHPQA